MQRPARFRSGGDGRRRQVIGEGTGGHLLQFLTQLQPIQLLPGKLTGLDTQGRFDSQLATPADEILGDLLRFSPAVGHFGAQDVPDDDQQLAGHSDNGLLLTDAISPALELLVPALIGAHGRPGGLDQDPAQFAPPLFGNTTGAVGLA